MDQYLTEPSTAAIALLTAAVVLGVLLYAIPTAYKKLMGKYQMRKREKRIKALRELLGNDFMQVLEDHICDVFTEAVYTKRISDDQARIIYADLAHRTGLWGLHPRKFSPNKTPEALQKLKEQLKARRIARESVDDLAAELG